MSAEVICIDSDSSDDDEPCPSRRPRRPNANDQLHTKSNAATTCTSDASDGSAPRRWQKGANNSCRLDGDDACEGSAACRRREGTKNSCRLDGGGKIAAAASRTFDETDDDSDSSSVSSSDSILNVKPMFGKPSAPSARLDDGLSTLKPEKHRKCKYFDLARAASSKRSAELASVGRKQAAYAPGNLPPSVDAYLGTWQIRLLMDFREFGLRKKDKGKGFIDIAKKRIDGHFAEEVCEQMHLQSADYMFVARLISNTTKEVIDERVIDLLVERKNVNDLCSCLISPSKSFPPLKFFEAQMYKLQHCGLENKVFLLEGDENDRRQFKMRATETKFDNKGNQYRKFGTASREEQLRRLKRVKTIRNQMIQSEFTGVRIVCTKDREDTVKWLIQQLELIRRSFDPTRPPGRVKSDFDNYVKAQMKDDTFQEYLRLLSMEKIGDKKAMRIIKDPLLKWDKQFISPREAQSLDTTHSKLDDKPIFWNPDDPPVEHAKGVGAIRQTIEPPKTSTGEVKNGSKQMKLSDYVNQTAEQAGVKSNPVTPSKAHKSKRDGCNVNDDSSSSGSSMNGDSNMKKVPSGECDESIIDLLDDESDVGDDDSGVIVID